MRHGRLHMTLPGFRAIRNERLVKGDGLLRETGAGDTAGERRLRQIPRPAGARLPELLEPLFVRALCEQQFAFRAEQLGPLVRIILNLRPEGLNQSPGFRGALDAGPEDSEAQTKPRLRVSVLLQEIAGASNLTGCRVTAPDERERLRQIVAIAGRREPVASRFVDAGRLEQVASGLANPAAVKGQDAERSAAARGFGPAQGHHPLEGRARAGFLADLHERPASIGGSGYHRSPTPVRSQRPSRNRRSPPSTASGCRGSRRARSRPGTSGDSLSTPPAARQSRRQSARAADTPCQDSCGSPPRRGSVRSASGRDESPLRVLPSSCDESASISAARVPRACRAV